MYLEIATLGSLKEILRFVLDSYVISMHNPKPLAVQLAKNASKLKQMKKKNEKEKDHRSKSFMQMQQTIMLCCVLTRNEFTVKWLSTPKQPCAYSLTSY